MKLHHPTSLNTVNVAAAVMINDDKVFATKRAKGAFAGFWEFPGGKIEPGETSQEALHREIWEELRIKVEIEELLCVAEYDYPDFHLHMYCYICKHLSGDISLMEHDDAKWIDEHSLEAVTWLPADIQVLQTLKEHLQGQSQK